MHRQVVIHSMVVFCDTNVRKAGDMSLWPYKGPLGVVGQQGPHNGGVGFEAVRTPARLLRGTCRAATEGSCVLTRVLMAYHTIGGERGG